MFKSAIHKFRLDIPIAPPDLEKPRLRNPSIGALGKGAKAIPQAA